MNDENTSTDNQSVTRDTWPRKLNKVLIGGGVLVFGLIIADRLLDTFRADDMPDMVDVVQEVDTAELAAAEPIVVVDEAPESVDVDVTLDMEAVFGGRLVFVSASEPLYVVTEDDRRIEVGDSIDDDTLLAGITGQGVIVDKSGDLLVIRLPDLGEN